MSSLVVGVVVGHSGVGDACLSQAFCPLGFAPKDEVLVDWGYSVSEGALEVDNHSIGLAEYTIDACKQGGDTLSFCVWADATIEQDVASEKDL